VTEGQRLELLRPRDIGGLFRDSFNTYAGNFPAFLALSVVVVVPVQLVVSGLGLGQLRGGYSTALSRGTGVVLVAETYLLIIPLVTAMVVHALLVVADGVRPKPGAAILNGLEAFTPVFLAVVLAAAGVVGGFILFIVPGVWLLVRWYFAPQAVVLDGRHGMGALQRSAELVTGTWWRVAGITLLVGISVAIASQLVALPFEVWAKAADSKAIQLVGEIVASVVTAPFQALMLTLLYFDLLARRSLPATVPPVAPPPL
jgi:hypothetical protein